MSKKGSVKIEEKDREIIIDAGRLYLGDDNILYITPLEGNMDEQLAIEACRAALGLQNMIEGKVNALIDLNRVGKQSAGARQRWKEWNDNEKTGKVAYIGLHPVARVLAAFVMGITRKKDARFFKTEEEALAWLKE